MSDDAIVWRRIYGKDTLFCGRIARGDYYKSRGADGDIWRLRIWNKDRLQGGRERYVDGEVAADETAEDIEALVKRELVAMLRRAQEQEANG